MEKTTRASRSIASECERNRRPTVERAYEQAVRLLGRRSMSERELRSALEARGVARTTTDRVLGRCRRLGYIDDRRFAVERAEGLRERGFGARKIRWELERRGIGEKLAGRALPSSAEELEVAKRWIDRRFGASANRRRVLQALVTRGFSEDVIESLTETLAGEDA